MHLSNETNAILTKIFENKENVELIKRSLTSISDKETLLYFVLDFYKDKILKEKSYFELISVLSLNYKGLSMEEILRIVYLLG